MESLVSIRSLHSRDFEVFTFHKKEKNMGSIDILKTKKGGIDLHFKLQCKSFEPLTPYISCSKKQVLRRRESRVAAAPKPFFD